MTDWTALAKKAVAGVVEADARLSTDMFAALLTEDVLFRAGNAAPVHGKQAVKDLLEPLFTGVRAMRHSPFHLWVDGSRVAAAAELVITRMDGSEVAVPFVDMLTLTPEGLISEYRVVIDLSVL